MNDYKQSLSTLLSASDLPATFGVLKDQSATFLDDIYVDHFKVIVGENGRIRRYQLKLHLDKKIGLEIPGGGNFVSFLINPDDAGSAQSSTLDIELDIDWPLLAVLVDASAIVDPTDLTSLYTMMKDGFDLSDAFILERISWVLHQQAPFSSDFNIETLVNFLNDYFHLHGTTNEISYSDSPQTTYTDVANAVSSAGLNLADPIAFFGFDTDYPGGTDTVEQALQSFYTRVEVEGPIDMEVFVDELNVTYSLTGTANEIVYSSSPQTTYDDLAVALSNASISTETLIADYLIPDTADFDSFKDLLVTLLWPHDYNVPGSFEEFILPLINAEISNLTLAVEFPRSWMIPLDTQNNDQPLASPATSKLRFSPGSFYFNSVSGFDFDNTGTLSFDKSNILNTGLTFEFTNATLDFSKESNIPEATNDGRSNDFVGIFIPTATIGLPNSWTKTSGSIVGSNLLIGNPGGISGTVALSGGNVVTELGGIDITLSQFDLTLDQNSVSSFLIAGTLNIPGLEDGGSPADISITATFDSTSGSYNITGSSFPTVTLFGIDLTINSLAFDYDSSSLSNFSLLGTLSIPQIKDTSGAVQPIDIDVDYDGSTYSVSLGISGTIACKVFGIDFEISALSGSFDSSGLTNLEFAGKVTIPGIKNTGGTDQPIDVYLKYTDNGTPEYTFRFDDTTAIPALEVAGFDFAVSSIGGSFTGSTLTNFNIAGTLEIPGIEDASENVQPISMSFTYDDSIPEYTLDLVGTFPTLKLFGIEFKLTELGGTLSNGNLTNFNIDGEVKFPEVRTKPALPALPQLAWIPLNLAFDTLQNWFSFSIPNIHLNTNVTNNLSFIDIDFKLTSIGGTFTKSGGLNAFNIAGELTIEGINDSPGDQPIGLSMAYTKTGTTREYQLSLTASLVNLSLFGIDLSLNEIRGKITNGSLDNLDLVGEITVPGIDQSGGGAQEPIGLRIRYAPAVPEYSLHLEGQIVNAEFFDMDLTIDEISGKFDKTGLNNIKLKGDLTIEQIKDDSGSGIAKVIAIELAYNNPGFTLGLKDPTGIINAKIAQLDMKITSLAATLNGGLTGFDLRGSVSHPEIKNSSGQIVELTYYISYSQTPAPATFTFSVSAPGETLKIAGLDVTLQAFSFTFTRTTLTAISITGTTKITGLKNPGTSTDATLDITLKIETDKFLIEADYPAGLLLEVPNLMNVTIYSLGIGWDGTDWYILTGEYPVEEDTKGTDIEVLLTIPLVDKYIPDSINIESLRINSDATTQDEAVSMSWDDWDGPSFGANGGAFDVEMPVNKTILNLLTIAKLHAKMESQTGGGSVLSGGVSGSMMLGPLKATATNVGVKVDLERKPGNDGNFGPFDLDNFRIKPPEGLGISIETSAMVGAGYLGYDEVEKKYTGAAEVTIKDKISLKAVGILITQGPQGGSGYSLLLLITATGFTPIQLGFGFTLTGIGGLVALHRTMRLQVLRDGVKNNSLDNILFPDDPVGDIEEIVTDLDSAFPVQQNRFTFGIMGIINWGTPALITMEVGLMLEVPNPVRFAVLGVIKSILPTEDKDLLRIQVNFLGTIDFEAKYITFDASLFASRLMSFTLSGDMAFRLKWGNNSSFLLSVGGFHPAFTPPPLNLPSMRRLTINLLGGNRPRLTIWTYFAITSNTIQFGAGVDFYFKVTGKIKVVGQFGLDVLIQFAPFYLRADVYASLAVMRKNKSLLSVSVNCMLEGPSPWHAKGKAKFKVLGLKLKVDFDKTFGRPETNALPNVKVLEKLEEEAAKADNWKGELPKRSNLLVRIKEPDTLPANTVLTHPFGSLQFVQKAVPLDLTIERFSKGIPQNYDTFTLDITKADNTPLAEKQLKEDFARGEFFNLTNADKLSYPSFEKMHAGVRVTGTDEYESSFYRSMDVRYDTKTYDTSLITPGSSMVVPETLEQFEAGLHYNAMSNSSLGRKNAKPSVANPTEVVIEQERYAISNRADLSVYSDGDQDLFFESVSEAQHALKVLCAANPALEEEIEVVSSYEISSGS